jgi:hypothetical protein
MGHVLINKKGREAYSVVAKYKAAGSFGLGAGGKKKRKVGVALHSYADGVSVRCDLHPHRILNSGNGKYMHIPFHYSSL